jgi:hypothetical protein
MGRAALSVPRIAIDELIELARVRQVGRQDSFYLRLA